MAGHREALLEGALRCLQERGYARTTARDIVAASGTNLGSIVYHFGTKEALLNEAVSEGFQRWLREIESIALDERPDEPVAVTLQRSLGAMFASIDDNRALFVAFTEAIPQAERTEELRLRLAEGYRRARRRIAELVEQAIGADAPSEVIASLLLALGDGLMLQYVVDPENAPGAEEVMAGLASGIVALTSGR